MTIQARVIVLAISLVSVALIDSQGIDTDFCDIDQIRKLISI
jgi:hypothetical protein